MFDLEEFFQFTCLIYDFLVELEKLHVVGAVEKVIVLGHSVDDIRLSSVITDQIVEN